MKRLLVFLLATAQAYAALSFNASNTTGVQAFGATPPETDWSTASLAGASGNLTTVAAVDAAAQALTATDINTVLGTQAGNAINAIAQRNSTANFIYTAPTGNNATALMATLQNDSGAAVSAINIAYNHTRIGTATEESMGHRVFYSLTGLANSWTLIPGLSGISANQALGVTVSLSAPWANTGKLYLLWVDDNGSGSDTPFTIDDFVLTVGNPLPVVTLTAPANGGTASAPGSFPLTATATDDGSVAQVEFLRNGGVIHTDNTPPYEYTDSGLAAGNYSYAARAADNLGATATSAAANVSVFTNASQTALQFDGMNDYVTMGAATSTLGAATFTVECWFKRTGAGTGNATTGTNGLAAAIPLVTKGRSEADNSNLDCNYFLGIDNATGRLCADFEATLSTPLNGTGADNNNYPVFGTTVIPQNVWTHAAMTWDGNAWKLFVNGVEETITVPNLLPTPRPVPRADSIQHFSIASALNSTGVAAGFFQGAIDEVRVWNVARTPAEILALKDTPITGAVPGLLASYALNEGTGITAASGIGTISGTLTNGPLWTDGVVLTPNAPPVLSLTAPADLATNLGNSGTVTLSANVSDPESQPMTVTFYGRLKLPPAGPDFTLVTLPDTQFYSQNTGGNRLSQFIAQTNWIVSSKDTLNTVFVAHMGDMVQNGDAFEQEWINADSAMDIIENPATTLLTHGIPWGGAPGNHDFTPISNPAGTSIFWNQYFGVARWAGRPYFQGNYGANNNNNYQFFSASGLDFIVINLAYNPNTAGTQAIMDWADALLKAHPTRRAIITSHWFIGTGNPASWGGHGQAVYDNLKDNPNLFMMLCGHIHGEGRRQDTFEGRTVHTLLQDYQDRTGAAGGFGGGDGWLRYYTFSPASNEIHAKTYRATSGEYETDADSQFSISYNMGAGTAPWTPLGTLSSNGGSVTLDWTGLAGSTEYEWYAAVSDGANSIGGTVRRFTTAPNASPTVSLTSPAAAATVAKPAQVAFAATAGDTDGSVGKVEFFAGAVKVGEDLSDPYDFNWTAISGSYALTAVATDNQGARTTSTAVNITVTNPSNVAPSVSIDTPAAGASVPGGNVALAASASDTDGVVSKVEFFHGAVKIGEDATAPFTFNWQAVAAGSYTITAVATDNDGGSSTSAPVGFTVTPVTDLSFQEGSGGYSGTQDTYVRSDAASQGTSYGSASDISVDGDDGSPDMTPNHGLLRFDNIVGPGVLQIPPGSTINSATLRLNVFNAGSGMSVHRMLSPWSESSTWTSLGAGIQTDDVEAAVASLGSVGANNSGSNVAIGLLNFNVAAAVQAWANGQTNHGFAFIPFPAGTDGIDFRSSEYITVADRPLLIVNFTRPPLPEVVISASDAAAGEFGADQSIVFTVTRTGSTTELLSVPLAASGSAAAGVDYTGFISPLTIPAGQAGAALLLTVQADNEAEGSETVTVSLGSSAAFTAGAPASSNASIADKPEQGFYFANIADPAKRAPVADADGDANANVIEYYMGTLPDDANSRGVLEIPITGVNTFKVRYPRAKNRPDVGGNLLWSGNLTNWHAGGQSNGSHTVTFVEAVVSPPEADPEIIEATGTITGPGAAPAVFVRLAAR